MTGAEIRERRLAKGWTRLALAVRVGCNQNTIWYWEHGRYQPTRRSVLALEVAFGLRPEWELNFPPLCVACGVARSTWKKRECAMCQMRRLRARHRGAA